MFACADCAYYKWDDFDGEILAKNYSICACYTLDLLILNSFVLATMEESSLNSSYSL